MSLLVLERTLQLMKIMKSCSLDCNDINVVLLVLEKEFSTLCLERKINAYYLSKDE